MDAGADQRVALAGGAAAVTLMTGSGANFVVIDDGFRIVHNLSDVLTIVLTSPGFDARHAGKTNAKWIGLQANGLTDYAEQPCTAKW